MSNQNTPPIHESRDLEDERRAGGIARSLGSAVGFMRRLVPGTAKKSAKPALVVGLERVSRKLLRAPTRTDFDRMARELRTEIERLEADLRRLHATITSGAVPKRGDGGTPTLDGLIREARDLRERIHERRHDLARVERHIAREQRLRPREPAEAAEVSVPTPRRKRRVSFSRRESKGPQRYEDATGRRSAVQKALREASFTGRSERLAFERVAEGLLDSDPDVRRETVTRLAKQKTPVSFELMLVASGDPNERVRRAAVNALVTFGDRRAIRIYRGFLNDKDASLRLAALRGLGGFEAELSGADLLDSVDDADATIRKTAAAMLATRPTEGALAALLLALRDDDEAVRATAAESLGTLGDHRAVLSLIRAVADESGDVRTLARQALAAILDEDVCATVARKAKNDEARVAVLKEWWKAKRVEKALERIGGLGPLSPPKGVAEAAVAGEGVVAAEEEDWEKYESALPEEPEGGEEAGVEAAAEEGEEEEEAEPEGEVDEEAEEGEDEGKEGQDEAEEGEYEDIF